MSTNTTLFSYIVPLYGKTELVATEALRYILQQSEPARSALEQMLRTAGVEVGSLTRFQTEASGDEGERVDLVCYDEHGTERVLIEAKFWAGLTDNQPNTYLARLPEDTPSVLLFVAPAQRIETLWPELCRRAEKQHRLKVTSDTLESGELRGVSIDDNGHKMMLTSWRAVLAQMEQNANMASNLSAVADIRQLRGLTEREDSDAFSPLRSEELGPDFPRRVNGLIRLVSDACTKVIETGWLTTSGLQWTARNTGAGRYMWLADEVVVWFGIDTVRWAKFRDTPIWLEVHDFQTLDNEEVRRRLAPIGVEWFHDGNWWYIPIDLPTSQEYELVLAKVVDRLVEIASHVNPDAP